MQKNILLNLVAGATVAVNGLISIPVHAQNNQSDVTGNNVFNNNLPTSLALNTVSKDTVAQAEELFQKLKDAYRSCSAGEGCVEFNNLLQESNTFLSNLNQQVEAVGSDGVNRAW